MLGEVVKRSSGEDQGRALRRLRFWRATLTWRGICPAQSAGKEGLSDLPSSALLRRETLVPRQTARAMS